jgi:hypothetical protein
MSNVTHNADSGERLPNFLIIGVAKAGTSSLYAYLGQHPQIFVSPVRAPNFFGLGEQPLPRYGGPVPQRAIAAPTLAQYSALFAGAQAARAVGEGSSFFNFTPRAAVRIQHYRPDARLLLLLRQPAERAYSQYLYARRLGWEPAPTFAAALAEEARRKADDWFPFLRYVESSHYAPTLRAFLDHFPPNQIYIARFEDFVRNTVTVMRQIYQFLGVAPDFTPDVSIKRNPAHVGLAPWLRSPWNVRAQRFWQIWPAALRRPLFRGLDRLAPKPPPLDPALCRQLTNHFHTDILATQALIQQDLTHWLVDKNA